MPMKPAPTMQDVAQAAGYSRAAVSMALRDDPTIPEETRRQIAAAACRIGYRANPLVAALMSLHRRRRPTASTTTAIAYLTSYSPDDPRRMHGINAGMFDGATERATEIGSRVEAFNLRAKGMTPARMRDILLTRHIHALIVAPLPSRETSLDFDVASFAVVGLGTSVTSPIIERIANDHFQSAALAVGQCVTLGYRRIGFVLSQETSHRLGHRWLGGYRFAIEQHQLAARVPPLMTELTDHLATAMPAWLRRHQPDVVVLCHVEPDLQACVPATVGVVGLAVDRTKDELTGIFQDYHLLGRVAVEHAIAKLYTNSFGALNEAHLHLVAGTWVPGVSAPGPGRPRPC
jgi:DNA-binding LacI/PurR family transcriptional regulator